MDTQNTPIHVKLWHRDFWLLAFAIMFFTMSMYMLIPVLPFILCFNGCADSYIGMAMGISGIGVFILGCFCSYLVQRFRRNKVCVSTIIAFIICILSLYLFVNYAKNTAISLVIICLLRFLLGAFYGFAHMILSSTLVIDTCESFQRTEANHSAAWFSRFALSLGPIVGLITYKLYGGNITIIVSAVLALLSVLLILFVRFPFKAPDETFNRVLNLDRFFLPHGWVLFINMILITTIIGLLLSVEYSLLFYSMLMCGFLFAILAEKYVFADADLKSETITGLILIGTALILLLTRRQLIVDFLAPTFIGFGIGIIGSRFLLFFIKLSKHCQRGTSQSTFFLGWELGLGIGLFCGYSFYGRMFDSEMHTIMVNSDSITNGESAILITCIVLVVLSLLIYNFITHPWYMKNKNR